MSTNFVCLLFVAGQVVYSVCFLDFTEKLLGAARNDADVNCESEPNRLWVHKDKTLWA